MWDAIYPYVAALVPTIGLLIIAYVVFKTIFEADRKERIAQAQWERDQDRERARERAASPDSDPMSD
ncbi:MAG: lysyl-tRNA synthetase [Actinomycetales bacterium]|nr:lysyl-tRNA synthetase [Actinomycetales bacterium]